ncbi:hypothetical protein [Flagellimonas myxillae]|uniref:hypothetical protein n=1 Tax=Flagellimonas myxillae TaxID=2942214 RepID=UPI00201EC905|nr:hypothetical protein [Muricauda myxillae]MCL6266930.1 hypothetical protein [Muricauda myxillae]
MMKIIIWLLISLAPVLVQGQSEIVKLNIGQKELLVRITVPENYSMNHSYPVLFGPGLDGGDIDQGCRYFGKNPEQFGWILVESLVHMENRSAMSVLLDHIESNYTCGKKFLFGFSANSVAAFEIASNFSNRISGVIAMPGNPQSNNNQMLNNLSAQQIIMVVGERDTYWKKRAEKAKVILDKRKIWNRLVIVPNGGHILDEFTGHPLFSLLNKTLTFQ